MSSTVGPEGSEGPEVGQGSAAGEEPRDEPELPRGASGAELDSLRVSLRKQPRSIDPQRPPSRLPSARGFPSREPRRRRSPETPSSIGPKDTATVSGRVRRDSSGIQYWVPAAAFNASMLHPTSVRSVPPLR